MNTEKAAPNRDALNGAPARVRWPKALGWVAGVLLAACVVVFGVSLVRRSEARICPVSHRTIHAHSEAVMLVDGKESHVCCVRCALTYGRQAGKVVRLVSVNDFSTARKLQPEKAFYVTGSKLVLCEVPEPLFVDDKQPYPKVFDRCEPSVFAFARSDEADSFVLQNGGRRVALDELLREQEAQP